MSTTRTLSLEAAVVMTGMGRSTLWRHMANGNLAKGTEDARGRATLVMDGVLPAMREYLGLDWAADDLALLQQADAGDAGAQADLGAWLYVEAHGAEQGHAGLVPGRPRSPVRDVALHWLQQAAAQGNADAMHWMGLACAQDGPGHDHEVLMWLAQAATHGHAIARWQMAALLAGVGLDRG